MIADSVVEIIIRAKDEFSTVMKNAQTEIGGLQGFVKKNALAIGAVGAAMTAAGVASIMILSDWTKEAAKYEGVVNRLTQITKTSTNASDAQVKSLINQANALEQVGVVGRTTVMVTQSQLATFDMTTESIEMLTPALLDYIVAEKGVNATTEEAKMMTNGLAQALNGNFASLTRTGFVLTDVQRKMLSTGTETERVAALVEILNSTYKDFNKSARDTAEGGMAVLSNSFQRLKETVGIALLPLLTQLVNILQAVVTWFNELPGPVQTAIAIIAAIAAILLVLSGVILVVTAATAAFTAVNIWWIAIIVAAIAIIAALIAAGVWLYKNWDMIKEKAIQFGVAVQNVFIGIRNGVVSVWNFIVDFIATQINRAIGLINILIKGINMVPGINIGMIGKVSLDNFKGDMLEYKTYTPPSSATVTNVINITGDNYGTDPEEISWALADNLRDKILT